MFTRPPPIITRFLDLHAVRSAYISSPNPSAAFLPFDPIRSQYICPSRSHCLWRSHRSPVRHTALPHRITPISIIRSRYRTIPVLARRPLSLPRPWPPIWVHSPPTDTGHVAFGRRALTEAFVRGRRLEILPLFLIGIEVLLLRLGMVRHPVFGRTRRIFNMAWHQKGRDRCGFVSSRVGIGKAWVDVFVVVIGAHARLSRRMSSIGCVYSRW